MTDANPPKRRTGANGSPPDSVITSGSPGSSGIVIIDRPDLKTVLRNMGEWSFTTFMWVLWVYLFLPIINILLWVFGGHRFYITVVQEAHYQDAIDMFQNTGWFVLIVFLILRGWGLYNYHRFGKRERRKQASPVSMDQMADFFQVTEATVARMRDQQEVVWDGRYEQS